MKKLSLIIAVVLAVFALTVPFAAAQTESNVTYTETEINNSFWLNNPVNRNISNANINLQDDQATIAFTYTRRTARAGGTVSTAVSATFVPVVENGRVNWTLTAASADGVAASESLVNQINAAFATSWRRYISNNLPNGRITAVTITEDDITFTYTPW